LAAVIEIKPGQGLRKKPVAGRGDGAGSGIQFGALKSSITFCNWRISWVANSGQRCSKHVKAPKQHLGSLENAELAASGPVQHQNISRRKAMFNRSRNKLCGASLGKDQEEALA